MLGVRSGIQPDLSSWYIPSHISKVKSALDRPLKTSTWYSIIWEINVWKYAAIGDLDAVGTILTHTPYPFPGKSLLHYWIKIFVCDDDLHLASLIIQN